MRVRRLIQLILAATLLFQAPAVPAQQVFPVVYTHMGFPAQRIYDLPDAGLVAVANDFQIQLWDARSQAYFGLLEIFSPENILIQIRHLEYIKGLNQLAVIARQTNMARDKTFSYKDYLFVYDLSTLSLVSPPVPNGMAQLIKYIYGRRTILPNFPDADQLFQYHYSEATDNLFTIDSRGTLHMYHGGTLKTTLETGVAESRILGVSPREDRIFLADGRKAIFRELEYPDGKLRRWRQLLTLPSCGNIELLHPQYENFSVREAAPGVFMLLDSINRIRVYDYNAGYDTTVCISMPGLKLRSIDWDDKDSSILMIAESPGLNCKVISGKGNVSTGQNNLFDNGNSEAGFIGAVFNDEQGTRLRILLPGYGEHETDLTTLKERTNNIPGLPDVAATGAAQWEKGYVNFFTAPGGGIRIDVFQADSLQSRLLYSQRPRIPSGESLAAIRPSLKWWITTTEIKNYEKGTMTLRIYDSTGKRIFSETGCMPLQMLNTPYSAQQLFSPDERHMLIREFLGRVANEDSFRIRVFNTANFQPELDLRYTEMAADALPSCRAFFSKDSKRVYFTALDHNPWPRTVLYKYALDGNPAFKIEEATLCFDQTCRVPVSVNRIGYWKGETAILFTGLVNTSAFAAQPNYIQVVRCLDATTHAPLWFMNLPFTPVLRKVLRFNNFLGVQYDNAINFWKIQDNRFVGFLSLTPITNTASAAFSNLYLSSDPASPVPIYYEQSGNESLISFRMGNRSFGRSYFDLTFNRPDLIIDRIPGSDSAYKNIYYQAVLKRSAKITNPIQGFNPDDIPEIKLLSTGYERQRFRIRLAMKSRYPLRRLRVTVNGSPEEAELDGGHGLQPAADGYIHYDRYETLTNAENRIRLSVIDDHQQESLPLNVIQNDFRPIKKPVLHVLVVSVRHYDNGEELVAALQKGRTMAALFQEPRDTLFAARQVDTLFEQNATEARVLAWMDHLKETGPQDYVIVFFIGHGKLDAQWKLHLLTANALFKPPYSQSIDYEALLDHLDSLPARQRLFLIDACESGDFDQQERQASHFSKTWFDYMQEMFTFSQSGKGSYVFTSCNGRQNSYDRDYFERAISEGLHDNLASPDGSGRIWINDLFRYVIPRTNALSENTELPDLKLLNPDNNWRIK